jgi:adenosine deaminase
MAMLRERGIVLEVCPSSNLTTGVIRDVAELRFILRSLIDNEVPYTLSTDGPEMLRTHLRDEMTRLLRREIMSLDELRQAIETAHAASFVDGPVAASGELDARRISPEAHAPMALEIEV